MSSSERETETLHQICLSPSSSHFSSLFFSLSLRWHRFTDPADVRCPWM